jgi:hypothetical protein
MKIGACPNEKRRELQKHFSLAEAASSFALTKENISRSAANEYSK